MNKKGFTLIELIIVIAIIAILAAIAFVAVNPAKRIGEANEDQRWSDIVAIADAWQKNVADKAGDSSLTMPDTVSGDVYMIGSVGWTADDCTNADIATNANLDLTELITNGYLGSVPVDPLGVVGNDGNTGYYFKANGNTITVGACERWSADVDYAEVTR